jgi:hypothetical protein
MPTISKDAKQALYAIAGVADATVAAIRHLPEEAGKLRDRLPDTKTYQQLARRGESLVSGIRRSRVTRQASEATRVAISRSKAATTTARKAAEADAKAAKQAAGKVGDTPNRGSDR